MRKRQKGKTMSKRLIYAEDAIDAAVKMFEAWYGGSVLRDREIRARFDALPSAQPEKRTEERTETHECDLISRQAAIDAAAIPPEWDGMYIQDLNGRIREALEQLPSAQPEKRTEERTETHECDLISRQAAIDAAAIPPEWDGMYIQDLNGRIREALEQLPSAQPQACDDAISREDAKWVVFCNRDHVEDQTNAIDSLPCVQPKRMKGRWERKESDLSWWYECSECGESPLYNPYADEVLTSFCPWCGADMRETE